MVIIIDLHLSVVDMIVTHLRVFKSKVSLPMCIFNLAIHGTCSAACSLILLYLKFFTCGFIRQ